MKRSKILYIEENDDEGMLVCKALHQVIDQINIIESSDGRSMLDLLKVQICRLFQKKHKLILY